MDHDSITRDQLETSWALWVEVGNGTHALLMDSEETGEQVWIETDAQTASMYRRQYGDERTRVIVEDDAAPRLITCTAPRGVEDTAAHVEALHPGYRVYGTHQVWQDGSTRHNLVRVPRGEEPPAGVWPRPAADAARCYHPRSCSTCEQAGSACGKHAAGAPGHLYCTGTALVVTEV